MRIAITGSPKTGKTTLGKVYSNQYGLFYRSTDEVIDLGWSEASDEVCKWFCKDQSIIEGVTVPRALRKWLEHNPSGRPVDILIILANPPFQLLTPKQEAMAQGISTILDEIKPSLNRRHVKIEYRDARKHLPI